MGFTYTLALTLALVSLARTRALANSMFAFPMPTSLVAKCAILGALVLSLWTQLQILEQRQSISSAIAHLSPEVAGDVFAACCIAQALLLFALYRALRTRTRFDLAMVLVFGAIGIALGLGFVNTIGDVFAYVGNGMTPDPYDPPATAFAPPFDRINALWGTPTRLLPSPYGPTWTLLARLCDATSATLAGSVRAFQWLGACALAGLAFALRKRGLPVVALVLCNPYFVVEFIAQAHNDLVAVALVALASASGAFLAVALVAAAGALKVSVGLVGLVVFVGAKNMRTRIVRACSALALMFVAYAPIGPAYLGAVRSVVRAYAAPQPGQIVALHDVAIAACALTVAIALVRGRFNAAASWLPIALGQYPLENYAVWGVASAIAGDIVATYLIALPYAQLEVTNKFEPHAWFGILRLAVLLAIAALAATSVRRSIATRLTRARTP